MGVRQSTQTNVITLFDNDLIKAKFYNISDPTITIIKINIWNTDIWFESINGELNDNTELINHTIKKQYELGRTRNDLIDDLTAIVNLINNKVSELIPAYMTQTRIKARIYMNILILIQCKITRCVIL